MEISKEEINELKKKEEEYLEKKDEENSGIEEGLIFIFSVVCFFIMYYNFEYIKNIFK